MTYGRKIFRDQAQWGHKTLTSAGIVLVPWRRLTLHQTPNACRSVKPRWSALFARQKGERMTPRRPAYLRNPAPTR